MIDSLFGMLSLSSLAPSPIKMSQANQSRQSDQRSRSKKQSTSRCTITVLMLDSDRQCANDSDVARRFQILFPNHRVKLESPTNKADFMKQNIVRSRTHEGHVQFKASDILEALSRQGSHATAPTNLRKSRIFTVALTSHDLFPSS